MSSNDNEKQQNSQNNEKEQEKPKDWMDYINDFIKNPITTGVTGLAAGYLLGTYKASKDIDAIKEEHKLQIAERDQQYEKLIRLTNKLVSAKTISGLPSNLDNDSEENENTLAMEEDKNTKVYKYKGKTKTFRIQG
jgi:hypothetical protein